MPQITGETAWLAQSLTKNYDRQAKPEAAKIKLNQLASKLGFFYEKIRNAVDYNDEHLIRRNSLKRLINRQITFLGEKDPIKISQAIIHEFIRAKYLPNDTLPETDIEEVAIIVAKYLLVFHYLGQSQPNDIKTLAWMTDLLVCEIDEYLFPNGRDLAIVNFMYGEMVKSISFTQNGLDEKERGLQIYLAALRNLLKADQALTRYLLFKLYRPDWNNITPDAAKAFLPALLGTKYKIEINLNHSSSYQLGRMIKKQAIFFNLLREIIEQNPDQARIILADEKLLSDKVTELCNKNYKRIRSRLVGSIIRVITYIFFTKTVLAFLLELPYDRLVVDSVNWNALIINITFHPILMAVVALAIKVPGIQNTQLIIEEIKKIVYGQERKLIYKPRRILKPGSFAFIIFNSIYAVMFAVSFSVVVWILHKLHFNILSGALFVFFLTLVSFFGFRLRNFANQFSVMPRKENLINFIIDFFTLPIVRVGQFLSVNFAKINIFLFILDFAIETPFKMLVETLDKALGFIREKREEIS